MTRDDEKLMRLLKSAFDLHQQRQFERAAGLYARVLERDPDNFDALQLLGLCSYQMNRPEAALRYLNRALALRKDVASVFNHRGIVLRALQRNGLALADFGEAARLNPGLADAFYNRGNTLRELARLKEALADYRRAVALAPARFEYLNNLGGCLQELKQHEEALACYDRLLALRPDAPEGHYGRGLALQKLDRFEEAVASHDRCIALKPGDAGAHTDRGYCLKRLGRLEEARASYGTAIAVRPDNAEAELGLAQIASELGDFADAEARFGRLLSRDPENLAALCGMARVRKFSAGEPVIGLIEKRLSDSGLPDDELCQLHHAYAKICNDLGRYDDAIEHFALGKKLQGVRFDLARHTAFFAGMKALFTRAFFAARRDFGVSDERPVFIVGMPRSGTTLTEQILASHRLVEGLGELPDMSRLMDAFGGGMRDVGQFTAAVSRLQPEDAARLADRYRHAYRHATAASSRLIDKRPHNFEYLGVIALMFPKARIIHCRRDPLDNCLSMYMQDFDKSHGYNRDLATLGRYYRACEDLMSHWRNVLPLPVYDCVYEDIVADLETSARSLVAFLGLEWDPNCLRYDELDRQVRTPSLWQVRQRIYDSSVGRWRRYERHLGPLREGLGVEDLAHRPPGQAQAVNGAEPE